MTTDEAIAHAREVASVQKDKCEQCAKDHEQLAEWLEELKELRQQDGYNKGRADAINEFVSALIAHFMIIGNCDLKDLIFLGQELKEKKNDNN